MKKNSLIILLLATLTGLAIAWIDARPTWDDTGISVGMILLAATIFGYFSLRKPWLTGLAVSIWIPLYGMATTHHVETLIALIPGFAGAYLGYFLKGKS